MKRRLGLLCLALIGPLLLAGLLFHVSAAQDPDAHADKLDEPLQERLREQPQAPLHLLVHLVDQADLSQGLPADRASRRAAVVTRLQETAQRSQAGLLARLDTLHQAGRVTAYQPLWIVNAVAVQAAPDVVVELARRSDVERITLDASRQYVEPLEPSPADSPPRHWNLDRVRAPHVWHGLGVTGQDVTVAIMDTGVDWLHPDLSGNYRGNLGLGSVSHDGNWFDALDEPAPQPVDPHGHGTHVAGTAVGQNGIGVAPGANWIAVRIFNENGAARISDIHRGFQWLLAPNGLPSLAPDVVNGSWGSNGANVTYLKDVQALHQAGILTVFSAGNNGPRQGTIGSPASFTHTLAVAAGDHLDEVAWFSSRGPSPLTGKPKPDLAAPGTRIYATLPNGAYGLSNGTSMAAPHVAGAAALVLSSNPALSPAGVRRTLTETAAYDGTGAPDVHRGWGRLDTYAAVAPQVATGQIRGLVTGDGLPLPQATVVVSTAQGQALTFTTGLDGRYTAWLQPGTYRLHAPSFHYTMTAPLTVQVQAGSITGGDLALARLPHETIVGQVLDATNGQPLQATVSALSTPVRVTADETGTYTLSLPSGRSYDLRAALAGYRLGQSGVTLDPGVGQWWTARLEPTVSILLVDSGGWYYDSQIGYFRDALADAGVAYDEWPIRQPTAIPPTTTLRSYDVVVWSSPADAPGFVGAGGALIDYLESGGNLLVSGQNVARTDGLGLGSQSWWHDGLRATFEGNAETPFDLSGITSTAYAGLHFGLNGSQNADNQSNPARVAPQPGSLTQPILSYDEGSIAGLEAGWCDPYRIIFFGFGLEGAATAPYRAALVERSLQAFSAPPVKAALSLHPETVDDIVAPGQTVSYTFDLRNLSEVSTTTVQLELEGDWNASLAANSVKLGPCRQHPVTVTLRVPSNLPTGAGSSLRLRASADHGATAEAQLDVKTPENVLLVDDHRWHDREALYRAALDELGLVYDVWRTDDRGSPQAALLRAYDLVLWYTAYDWFQPVTPGEQAALMAYMENGGRLFLTSQDYLYYHHGEPFTRQYLGVLDYQEMISPTAAIGGHNTLVGDPAGSFTLTYGPYRNFSDGLVPGPQSQVHLWNNRGTAAGLATAGPNWRSIFWAFPFETLPPSQHAALLNQVIGWLGDLGASTVQVTPRIAPASTPRNYTLTIRSLQNAPPGQATITATLDAGLSLDQSSLGGGAAYDATAGHITWQGQLARGQSHQITFRATASGATAGTQLDAVTQIAYERHDIVWERVASSWIDVPDLQSSTVSVKPAAVSPGGPVTVSVVLRNDGLARAGDVSATLHLPSGLHPLSDTLHTAAGTAQLDLERGRLHWLGSAGQGQTITVTIGATTTVSSLLRHLPAGVVIDDGRSPPLVRSATLQLVPYRRFFPFAALPAGND